MTVTDVSGLRSALDGELLEVGSPGYDAARRPADARFADVRPELVVRCRSESDVLLALEHAHRTGIPVAVRGGGHCFAGRSSTDGMQVDLAGLHGITVHSDGRATLGAGCRLGHVYDELHAHGRTLAAGCGATVGMVGLTLGGGIGLLGRVHGLTCDSLVAARVVLAGGRVVDCDHESEPDLFWALRGAGGGQFGVVTSLTFVTLPEPTATRIEARWPAAPVGSVVTAWQEWAPGAPDEVTANLTVVAHPGRPVAVTLFGASLLDEASTRDLVEELCAAAGGAPDVLVQGGHDYHAVKSSFGQLDLHEASGTPVRTRSEFFTRPLRPQTVDALAAALVADGSTTRQLAFTAMGGAYGRVPGSATAFAHRHARFLLEHTADVADGWPDTSWAIARPDGTGGVYTNFPDPDLDDWAAAYHGDNHARLVAVKQAYDPDRLFDFPQAV